MIIGRWSGPPGRSSTSRGNCGCDDFCVRWDAGGWRPLGGLPHREGLVRTAGAAALGNRRPGGAAGDSRVGENAPKVRGSSGGRPREGAAAIAWEIGGGGLAVPLQRGDYFLCFSLTAEVAHKNDREGKDGWRGEGV